MEDYKEKLRLAKEALDSGSYDKETIEYIFPELKESEDERIRKELLYYIQQEKNYIESQVKPENSPKLRFLIDAIAWLEKQCKSQDKGEISDGYHTFNELYYYRMLYNAAFFNMLPKEWVHKSKKHHDGEECFGGGWFIVMANLPTGQVSNHYELKDWNLFQIPEKEVADKWDGHTPQEAAKRLHRYLLEKQGEQKPTDKVEPKFHEGDIIIHKELGGDYIHNSHKIIQVDILDKKYRLEGGLVAHFSEQDDYELVEQKPAWSEEDGIWIDRACMLLNELNDLSHLTLAKIPSNVNEIIQRLKSLKERMKGE